MALSYCNELKNYPPHSSQPNNSGAEIGLIREGDLLKMALIPEDDLPRMAKSRKMTYSD
jgi:hypothetical protein